MLSKKLVETFGHLILCSLGAERVACPFERLLENGHA